MMNKLHVPLGLVPLNTESAEVYGPAGAGEAIASADPTALSVGANVPLTSTPVGGAGAPSTNVTVMVPEPKVLLTSDRNMARWPPGPTRSMSEIADEVCDRPFEANRQPGNGSGDPGNVQRGRVRRRRAERRSGGAGWYRDRARRRPDRNTYGRSRGAVGRRIGDRRSAQVRVGEIHGEREGRGARVAFECRHVVDREGRQGIAGPEEALVHPRGAVEAVDP